MVGFGEFVEIYTSLGYSLKMNWDGTFPEHSNFGDDLRINFNQINCDGTAYKTATLNEYGKQVFSYDGTLYTYADLTANNTVADVGTLTLRSQKDIFGMCGNFSWNPPSYAKLKSVTNAKIGLPDTITLPLVISASMNDSNSGESTCGDELSSELTVNGSILSVAEGCDTYLAPHPITQDINSCCSYNATPRCNVGTDIPDIPCVVVLEFCADGSMTKTWDPDPLSAAPMPGHSTATGTWSYTGNQLTTDVTGTLSDNTEEIYSVAFTYTDGSDTLLRTADAAQDVPDAAVLAGSYSHNSDVSVIAGTFLNMTVNTVTALTVNADYSWSGTITITTDCTSSGTLCPDGTGGPYSDVEVTPISGIITAPGELIKVNCDLVVPLSSNGVYVLQ